MDAASYYLGVAGERFQRNFVSSFTDMTPQQIIRLVIVVGTYMLLRKYLIKWGAQRQMNAYEEEEKKEKEPLAKITPNQLRGQVDIPDPDSEGEADTTATNWGAKARKRQRVMLNKLLDAHEKKLAETFDEQQDKDIEEFLNQ